MTNKGADASMSEVQRTCTIRMPSGVTFTRTYEGCTIHDAAKDCARVYCQVHQIGFWSGIVHVLDEDNNAHVVAVRVCLKAEIDAENTMKI